MIPIVLFGAYALTQKAAVERRVRKRSAKYQVIRDWICGEVMSGRYPRGSMLPSEHDLMARFSVSRVTVRQALDELRASGLVEGRQGKGTFVSAARVVQELDRLLTFRECLERLGMIGAAKLIAIADMPPERCVTKALRLPAGASVTKIDRDMLADSTVISVQTSFLAPAVGNRLTGLDLSGADLLVTLERELGIELGYADLEIDVATAKQWLADRLGIEPGEPVIRVVRVTYDMAGLPIKYDRIHSRVDRLRFQVRLPRC